jgi:hypothetical protein
MNTMTPAQQQRESARQQREYEAAVKKAAREEARRQAAAKKATVEAERARQRSLDNAIRTGGKVVTSRLGQSIIRGVFGTLFGGKK